MLFNILVSLVVIIIIIYLIILLRQNTTQDIKQDISQDSIEYFESSLIDRLKDETQKTINLIYKIDKKYLENHLTKKFLDNIRNLGKSNIKLISESCNYSIDISNYNNSNLQ